MVAHSQSTLDGLTPGSLELAEVLWLASRLPPPAASKRPPRPESLEPPTPHEHPQVEAGIRPGKAIEEKAPPPICPPDPFLPTPFPEAPSKARPQDTLLPVAVLPDNKDVARDLADMVLPGRVREGEPLGDRGKLLDALTPLLRRRADPRHPRFDEERTVDLYAQTRLLLPVMEPGRGPAFDEVLLLVDGGVSMRVWRRQAEELRTVLASTMVFPRVRLAELDPGPVKREEDQAARKAAVKRLSDAAQLRPGGSLLLLLVSDTAGRHWWDGRMFAALEHWARGCPTAILHPLPMWHWNRTALAAVERVSVRNSSPAAANACYRADPLDWWEKPLPPGRDLPVPVLPLDQDSLGVLSAVVMGDPAFASTGVALSTAQRRQDLLEHLLGDRDLSAPSPTPAPLTAREAEERWLAFQSVGSPQAQQLLLVMANAPLLTLPVIDLLKAAKLPETTDSLPIAEVLISGLVARKQRQQSGEDVSGRAAKALAPEQIQFELQPAVADLLRDRLPPADRLDVIRRVSALVERRWNRSRKLGQPSFEAVLCDPSVAVPEGLEGVVQFASVTARLLDTLPGEKARAFAERIRRGSGLAPASPWPPSMAFEERAYDTARLVEVPPLEAMAFSSGRLVEIALRNLTFRSARLEPDGTLQRWVGEALVFYEPLQRAALPFGATAEHADPLALTLVEIPASTFEMGSATNEPGSFDDEKPRHTVRLESFFMAQTPITQAQWREVAGWKEREGEKWGRELKANPSYFQTGQGKGDGGARLLKGEASTDERPVENVSWKDAMEFCDRLSQRTGRTYTLPSEAQWEYACRAGTTTPFAFGHTLTEKLANYNKGQTTPVDSFPANAWGLQDMHGNVWEWCLDHWHESYEDEGAPTDGSAWMNKDEKGGTRLLRGGSWHKFPGDCRSVCRYHVRADVASSRVGFRVVCLPQGPSLSP